MPPRTSPRRPPRPAVLVALAFGLAAGAVWLALLAPREGAARALDAEPAGAPGSSEPLVERRADAPLGPASGLGDERGEGGYRARAAAGPDAAAPATDRAPLPGSTARLVVHVAARGDGAPQAGVLVRALAGELAARTAVTDGAGRAELAVPADVELRLFLSRPAELELLHRADAPALAAGETRELALEVDGRTAVRSRGRVVAAADGAPIEGALVEVLVRRDASRTGRASGARVAASTRTGRDGEFALVAPPRLHAHLRVTAPGFGPRLVAVEGGTDAAAGPAVETPLEAPFENPAELRVELACAAALTVALVDASGAPLAGVEVRASASLVALGQGPEVLFSGARDPSWPARTDAFGRARLSDLAPGVPLALTARVPAAGPGAADGASVVRELERELVLAAGAERTRTYTLGAGATLVGLVTLAGGGDPSAVAGLEVWCVRDAAGEDERAPETAGYLEAGDAPLAVATTDAEGRFVLAGLDSGAWRVGLAPAAGARGLAAWSRPVRIGPDAASAHVDLRAHRGLAIAGRVVDPSGAPVPGARVRASEGAAAADGPAAETDAQGRFELGPLAAGPHELAVAAGGALVAEPVRVEAGEREVLVRLARGGVVAGRVLRAGGEAPSAAVVTLLPREPTGVVQRIARCAADGTFRFAGLPAGRYDLCAHEEGARTVAVAAAVEAGDAGHLVLRLAPGATVELRAAGALLREASLSCGDARLRFVGDLPPGASARVVVPAGPLVVRWREADGGWGERRATLAPGERRDLVLESDA